VSTFRAQLRAGCKTVIDAVQAANPTLIAHTYEYRPDSIHTPCIFVDNGIDQPNITHDAGTRARDLTAFVHIVNKLTRQDQAADEQDALVDLVVDAFTDNPRAASSATLIEPVSVTSHEESDGTASYACSVVSVRGRIIEGRT
jgi:hypothetical protein